VDTNAIVAWKTGKLEFNGETLAEIAGTLERWYGVEFLFDDPEVRSCRYYMSFENTISLDKLLQLMTAITEMKYEFNTSHNLITISGKQCH
jgi:ferric-dicitrate binding protein FerR (iron transport regulator)